MRQSRIAYALLYTMAFVVAGIVGLLFEPPWLVYQNLPFQAMNSPVRAGRVVLIKVSRCNSSDVTRLYAVSHILEGSDTSTILPSGIAPIEPGCTSRIVATNRIPEGTLPGRYRLTGYGEIQGIVRTHSVRWQSEYFEVIP